MAKYGLNGIWDEDQLKQHKKVGKILEDLDIKPVWFDAITENSEEKLELMKKSAEVASILYPEGGKEIELSTRKANALKEELKDINKRMEEVGAEYPRNGIEHRRMSNNSVAFIEKPKEEFMDLVFEIMQSEGEPGFVNLAEAARRVLKSIGITNPTKSQIRNKAKRIGLNPCVK